MGNTYMGMWETRYELATNWIRTNRELATNCRASTELKLAS